MGYKKTQVSTGGGGGNSFGTIQVPEGTNPVADQENDTLTLESSDNSVVIEGDSSTDTIDITINPEAIPSGDAFKTVEPISGDDVVAGGADTLTLTSSDNSISIEGDSDTNTLDFTLTNTYLADGFTTVEPDVGTNATASGSDTLTLTSSDGSVVITGDTGNEIDFSVTVDINDIVPDQTGNNGKVLKTNGTIVSWEDDETGGGGGGEDSISGMISIPIDKTYILDSYAATNYTINSMSIKTVSGTCTAALQINGSNVTSLSAISVSSVRDTTAATGSNSVVAGDRVTLVISSSDVPEDLEFTVKFTR